MMVDHLRFGRPYEIYCSLGKSRQNHFHLQNSFSTRRFHWYRKTIQYEL